MTDALVSVVVDQLTTILLEKTRREVKLVSEVGKELNKLKSRLNSIRALLGDAEEKQIKEESIKLWLYKLKQTCYDMEDVLDEWNTASLMLQKDEADHNSFSPFKGKVCRPFNPCFSLGQVVQHRGSALKIKDISERLSEIDEEKNKYGFAYREVTQSRREESTSYTELSKLHGRDKDRKDLVSSLLCGGSDRGPGERDAKTIFVVGMGGVGKTALAQLVFSDGEVMEHFDHRIWVCVSEVFDGNRVAKEIIVSLESLDHVSARDLDSVSLQILVEKLCKSIQRKKVLLVLDDVWTDTSRSWESLNEAFKHAAPESRILVTTRKETVVGTMKSFCVFNLKQLNKEDCWKILSQEAFVGRTEEQCKSLEDMGRKIAEKCSGLPLAAKALGSMLRFRETIEEWGNILNSEVWNLGLGEVFAALLLSYYDLPSAEKQCFLYCSIFPKDFEIKKDDLIHQWMSQGYLSSSENMEIVGVGYFQCLVARSFFQDLEKQEDGSITCKIHDIVVDFARHLMGKELEFKELHTADNLTVQLSPEETRHLSVTLAVNTRFPTSILGAAKLHSLNIFKIDDEEEEETAQYLSNLLIQAKHLRLLNFHGGTGNIGRFPKEIGKLMHLRLIDLSDSKLKRLPEAMCKLCNLQSLYLRRCYYLEKLPDKMEKLISLRYLDTTECCMTCYPKGIGKLTSLRDLKGIVVRCDRNDNEEFCLGDLENLDDLRVLMLIVVGDEIDDNESSRANLHGKAHLNDLEVGTWEDGVDSVREQAVINALNPAPRTNARFVRKRIQLLNKIRAHFQAVRARVRQR
ncbi:hypothetical protein SLA2020_163780 [Shorea laevis]